MKNFISMLLLFTGINAVSQIDRDQIFSLPSVTDTQMSSIVNPRNGSLIYNSTNNRIYQYNGTSWISISNATGTEGSIFFAGSNGELTENNNQLFWNNTNNRLFIGTPLLGNNKLNVNGTTRTTGLNNANGTVGLPSYRFTSDSDTGMYRPGANQLAFSTNGTQALSIDALQNITIGKNLNVSGSFLDSSGDSGTANQILTSTGSGTNWINNPATSNWLITGNAGTTNANFLGTTDDRKMQIRSNNISILEFGRRQTLNLTQSYPDYTDNNQYLVHVRGNNGVSALQFLANGASFYKPMFFTTPNGSFRLKGSSGRTDFFEIGSAGPNNQGRLEFTIADDGDEPIVFKRYDYRNGTFYKEFFRVQGSTASATAKTRFGININTQNIPITNDINANYNAGSFRKANSTFEVNGSVSKSILRTTSSLNLGEDHYTIIITNRNHSILLPNANSCVGRIYVLKNLTNQNVSISNYIRRNNNSSTNLARRSVYQLQSDGINWQQIN